MDSVRLAEHRRLCVESGADACLVQVDGRVLDEWYGPGYTVPMYTMSSVKSWTAILAGMLIEEGKLELDKPVQQYLPSWPPASRVTLRHLLSMTSGLKTRHGREPGPDQSIGYVEDKLSFITTLPLTHRPGEKWEYSNEGAQLLSPILQQAAGEPLEAYAERKLFKPLGMDSTRLRVYPAGQPWTYADAETTLRDFAKICQLMLDKGRWKGTQVVAESWIDAMTSPIPENPGYGFLWWILPGGFSTRGYLNTECYVYPAGRLVVARMQKSPKPRAKQYWQPGTWKLITSIVTTN